MKAVLTRVRSAAVRVDGKVIGAINPGESGGILALVGVARDDTSADAALMARKIADLRILESIDSDDAVSSAPGPEVSAADVNAPILLVSQFTLQGATRKGRRPSWSAAAPGSIAAPLLAEVVAALRERGLSVAEGQFGAMMEVESVNLGPFTVLVDTK